MDDKAQGELRLEDALSYRKAHISVHDVLASELSYSLIYDNVDPGKIDDALATVGLASMPNYFFLIQVDNYQNYVSKLHPTQEFFRKTALMNIVRECMKALPVQGFAANLIGRDNFICYLCCGALEKQNANEYLYSVADAFKRSVRTKSPYTISVCISQRCDRLSQFSKMYPRMNLALDKTYFIGKEVSILLEEIEKKAENAIAGGSLNDCYLELVVSISQRNRERFEQVLQKVTSLLESYANPQRVRLEIIRLIQRVGEYCIRYGVPENKILAYNEAAMNQVLECRFITDAQACFREYYERVSLALEEFGMDVKKYVFSAPVEEYTAEYYQDTIQLGDIAKIMGFSEGHFARTFRKQFGMTFIQYLTEYRIVQSRKLLAETNIPIEQVAGLVGFNSYSYFCTCFKRACGLSPGVYRGKAPSPRQEDFLK